MEIKHEVRLFSVWRTWDVLKNSSALFELHLLLMLIIVCDSVVLSVSQFPAPQCLSRHCWQSLPPRSSEHHCKWLWAYFRNFICRAVDYTYFIVFKCLELTCLLEILSQVLSLQHIYIYWFLWERPSYICAYLRTMALMETLKTPSSYLVNSSQPRQPSVVQGTETKFRQVRWTRC
jgi:hypothetical protein